MANIYDPNFNKNVVEVYTEEPGFTGYKGLDWNKLDSIEDILTGVGGTGPNFYLSGILNTTSGILKDTISIDNKLFITGDPWPAGVQGTIAFQADLSAQYDNVDIAGYAGADISGIRQTVNSVGVDVSGIRQTVNSVGVDVSGINYNISKMSSNYVNFVSMDLRYDTNNNNTGIFYKDANGSTIRRMVLSYDASNNLTGLVRTDF